MTDAESIRRAVESRAPFSAWLGVILLFALFGAIVLVTVGSAPRGDTYEQIRAEKRVEKLKTLRESDAKQLTGYTWIDKNKGVVGLPIERAMVLAIADLAAKKPARAYPIATPTAAPEQPATASPAPAPSAQPRTSPKPISVAGPLSESGGQPAAAVKPAGAPPATQPGSSATPAATPPQPSTAIAPASQKPAASPPTTPSPAAGKSPSP
jgi:hypothetical protein